MMVQEHISLRQLLLREEDVLSWYSMPIRQTSSLKRAPVQRRAAQRTVRCNRLLCANE